MIRDYAAFTALAMFLYGMGLVALAMDEPPHGNQSAIVAATERN